MQAMTLDQLTKLSNEELRVKCAEACGWMDIYRCGRSLKRNENGLANGATHAGTRDKESFNYGRAYQELPRYPTDLNAMHEAENWLRTQGIKWIDYETRIGKCATARERCIAFLMTIERERN